MGDSGCLPRPAREDWIPGPTCENELYLELPSRRFRLGSTGLKKKKEGSFVPRHRSGRNECCDNIAAAIHGIVTAFSAWPARDPPRPFR